MFLLFLIVNLFVSQPNMTNKLFVFVVIILFVLRFRTFPTWIVKAVKTLPG